MAEFGSYWGRRGVGCARSPQEKVGWSKGNTVCNVLISLMGNNSGWGARGQDRTSRQKLEENQEEGNFEEMGWPTISKIPACVSLRLLWEDPVLCHYLL